MKTEKLSKLEERVLGFPWSVKSEEIQCNNLGGEGNRERILRRNKKYVIITIVLLSLLLLFVRVLAAITDYHRVHGLNNQYFFLTILRG